MQSKGAKVFAISKNDFQAFREAKAQLSQQYLQPAGAFSARAAFSPIPSPSPLQNLVGFGIGEQISNGVATGVLAVKALVRVKYPDEQIPKSDVLPKTIHGLPVDVEQTGTFRRFEAVPAMTVPDPRARYRPAQPGCSIGFADPQGQFKMAGTFGAVVMKGGHSYILSNNHVLADENRLPAQSPIYQPGLLDGGSVPPDRVATLDDFITLTTAGTNKVDCAIAAGDTQMILSKDILFIGPPNGTVEAQLDMDVHKFGRTTQYRAGRITSVDTDVTVSYEMGNVQFTGQILIVGRNNQAFSAAGDSGSLILERGTNRAVGLLFAGSTSHTIANHIGDVLSALGVTLA